MPENLIQACRDALDAWVRLIEYQAHGETTMTTMTPDGTLQDALETLSAELLDNVPYVPMMVAIDPNGEYR